MKKRFFATLILAAIFCLSFLCIKYFFIPLQMQNANFGTQTLCEKDAPVEKLFIGSSMFRQGIDIINLSNGDNSSFLLAFNGNQPYYELIELKDIVNSGTKVKTVYIDMYAYSLNSPVWLSDSRLILGKNFSFISEIFNGMKTYSGASLSELYQLFISENNELIVTWPVSFPLINSRYTNGGANSETKGTTSEALKSAELHTESTINEIQRQSIINIIEFCKQNSIDIVFLETPKYFRQADEKGYISIMREYEVLINEYNAVSIISDTTADNIKDIIGSNTSVYSFNNTKAEYYTDLIHLSSDGRNAFTEAIRDLI